jgi:thioredoxin-dependent peroxiredoxin
MIQEGQRFPDFKLNDQDGNPVSLEDLAGRKAVVYFYPKDDTSGCTLEACEFRDLATSIEGARILGISPDDEKSHLKFIAKHNLNFTLLVDRDHKLAEKLGLWIEKSMYGKKYMGVDRTTYLLDEQGKVLKVWSKVKPEGHAREVQAALS